MLIIRLDLGYKESFREKGGISFEEAHDHRALLLAELSRCKIAHNLRMLGYAWKLERGPRKGLHYHMLFFFDGSLASKDVQIARMIGERWSDTITRGKGVYYNCNAKKGSYKYCGVGMVHCTDAGAREGLRCIVVYMTKLDEYFKLSAGKFRCFGKGGLPKLIDLKRGKSRIKISF